MVVMLKDRRKYIPTEHSHPVHGKRKGAPAINKIWTQERIDALTEMYALTKGSYMSVMQIAQALNQRFGMSLTRNAVVGKAERLGLAAKYPRADKSVSSGRGGRPQNPTGVISRGRLGAAAKNVNPLGTSGAARILERREQAAQPVVPANTEAAKGIPLNGAPDTACLWPIGKVDGVDMCCGQLRYRKSFTRPGSYCREHAGESTNHVATALAPSGRRNGQGVHIGQGSDGRWRSN